jgi:hypothetical protein
MTSAQCSASRPFTIAICTRCPAEPATDLLEMLRASIRRCPHAMLVTTECLLGQLICATRGSRDGVMAVLQPCSRHRTATAPAQWIGPVTSTADARAVRDWVEHGGWNPHELPAHLRVEATLSRSSIRN